MRTLRVLILILLLGIPSFLSAAIQNDFADSHHKKLRVAVTDDPPYTMKTEDGRWTGFSADLWVQVAREHKWDYELVEMQLEDIIRALHEATIDLTIYCLFQTAERERLFEFSTSLGSTRLALAALPDRIEHPWLSALRIFISWSTLEVIGSLVFLLFVTGLILWLIERKRNPEHFGGGFIKGISSGIYWVGSTLTSNGCFGIELKSLAGRLAGLVWMFICAIVLSAFIASLTSSLTLAKLTTPVLDLKNLRTMHLGTVKGSVPAALLQKAHMQCSLFAEEQEVLEALSKKQIEGFLFDEATLNYYASKAHGEPISVYPTNMKRLNFAFGMPNGSPLRKEINASLLELINEPYWEFLAEYYGLSENHDDNNLTLGRRRRK
jgi:ABC-type amino acid transport substrate-binding protein